MNIWRVSLWVIAGWMVISMTYSLGKVRGVCAASEIVIPGPRVNAICAKYGLLP